MEYVQDWNGHTERADPTLGHGPEVSPSARRRAVPSVQRPRNHEPQQRAFGHEDRATDISSNAQPSRPSARRSTSLARSRLCGLSWAPDRPPWG